MFTTETRVPGRPAQRAAGARGRGEAAGVAGAGLPTLRHCGAVDWLESGVHIRAVADFLGHSSVAVTGDVYGHTSDDAARALSGLAGRLGLS